MIFGNVDTFALEAEIHHFDTPVFLSVRIFVAGNSIGDFAEIAMYGPIAISITMFMKFSKMRELNLFNREAFNYLYEGIYGEDWEYELYNQLRLRFSLHDLFDDSIGNFGHCIFVINHIDQSEILLGMNDGVYEKSFPIPLGCVEQVLSEFTSWVEESQINN